MTRDEFWILIAAVRDGGAGDFEGRPARLRERLLQHSPEEVASFVEHFEGAMDDAYSHELWGAAYVIGGGCSDDSFMDFRKWLISCGRERYQRALIDPDSLADVTFGPNDEQDAFFEEFSIVIALKVHVELAGVEPPPRRSDAPHHPHGQDWDEDDLPKRYPRLWRLWGEVGTEA